MKKTRKRYATGTSVKNYIDEPNEILIQNQINSAKAMSEASSDPVYLGLKGLGNATMQAGLSMGGFGGSGLGQIGNSLLPLMANTEFATGGTVPKVPVEVEGKEVMETPDGTVAEFNGPSHENGGIPIDLPEGTKIFSKRLEKMGQSMAERKKKREQKVSKLEKLLEKNPKDTIAKKTLNKILTNNEIEEQADMQFQEEMTQMMEESIAMACGGKVRKKMNGGGIVYENYPMVDYTTSGETFFNDDGSIKQQNINYDTIPYIGKNTTLTDNIGNSNLGNELQLPNNETTIANYQLDQQSPTYMPLPSSGNTDIPEDKTNTFANLLSKLNIDNPLTSGDIAGLAGTAISTFSPYLNTLKNRASDTPNINYFENYGEEGLQTLDKSKKYISQEKDKALQDLELARQSQLSRSRNSARGINTLRAFDLAATQAADKASGDIYSSFANQMLGVLGQEASMQNQQDQVVMGGERARDIANRMDRDNFYSQLASSMSNIGTGLQAGGKSLNQIKGRGDNAAMIEELKQMGFDQNQINNLIQLFLKSQV